MNALIHSSPINTNIIFVVFMVNLFLQCYQIGSITDSISAIGLFLAQTANEAFLRACTEVLDVVAASSPGISIPAELVFPAPGNCPGT